MRLKALIILALMMVFIQDAQASRLPENVWDYIKRELPRATQRFDSVIVLDENTMYVPLYPAQRNDVESLTINYTYPNKQTLKQKPEVVVFNNNFALLKIFKDSKGNYTITKKEDLPQEVKLGVMPQDMLVPTGLKVPESLKLIMGDLVIPNRGDNLLITTSDATLGDEEENSDSDIVPIAQLSETKTFIANKKTKFVLVYDRGGKEPLYEIKLSGLPSKIIASPLTKFALTMYFGSKTAEVVDLVNERILTRIDFENIPSDADIDTTTQIAYVTSAKANSIYLVDLNSATLIKTIKLDRTPNKISVSGKDKMLVFNDKSNENLYIMDLSQDNYPIKKIANVKNLSRLLIGDNRIVAVSRTLNKAYIYKVNGFEPVKETEETIEAVEPVELISELDLAEKPTDALIYDNKAFILCSKDGIINVYDFETDSMLEPIALNSDGFYSKMTLIPNKDNAVVTGINTKKMIIIDLIHAKLEKRAKADIDVADIVIVDKKPPVKFNAETPAVDVQNEETTPDDSDKEAI